MSVFAGPEVPTNGLVFAYDMTNTLRSWRGSPTTNVVTNKLPTTGWGVNNYLTSSATSVFETENGIPHLKITNVVADSGYPRLQDNNLISTVTDGCSASFEAKGTPGAQLDLSIYSAGSTKVSNIATLTSDWQRFTFNNIVTGFTLDQPYIRPLTTTATYFIRNIQIEQNSFATPFVAGTRSNTQALLDLTNSNTVTATSLTYASDGSFSFNGSSNYIDSNPVALTGTSAQSITWACWARLASGTGDIINMVYPTTGWNMCPIWASGQVFYARVWSNGVLTSGTTFALNQYYYLVLVRNNATNTNSFYINGQLVASQIGAYSSSGAANNHYFGRAGAQATNTFFNGQIPVGQIYTRALSESEVQKNFRAARSRFGI